jgi:type II secretory pathway pseudopilin PulG
MICLKGSLGIRGHIMRKKFFSAFTLAEVLITLGIIGVVAALTIPTLMNNAQKKDLESGFKKSYTNLCNVYQKLYHDDGENDIDFSVASNITEFFSYFNVANGPTRLSNVYGSVGAMPFDKSMTDKNASYLSLSGGCPNFVVLNDGSTLWLYGSGGQAVPNRIGVDTNGVKPPNRLGYDVFGFIYSGGVIYPAPDVEAPKDDWKQCAPASQGGYGEAWHNGTNCARYAIRDICPWDSTKRYWEALP